jgi:hypothetical protein
MPKLPHCHLKTSRISHPIHPKLTRMCCASPNSQMPNPMDRPSVFRHSITNLVPKFLLKKSKLYVMHHADFVLLFTLGTDLYRYLYNISTSSLLVTSSLGGPTQLRRYGRDLGTTGVFVRCRSYVRAHRHLYKYCTRDPMCVTKFQVQTDSLFLGTNIGLAQRGDH